ncbi:MAG: NAD-dependent epimerase [Thermomicrobiales bacterium]|nr:NAD-dependent epimerase [Thermomicrobiales bacterium]
MTVVVTGAAGFIGFHVAARLLARGDRVVGFDNRSPYYDVALKDARLDILRREPGFTFRALDLADRAATASAFAETAPDAVVHLAAQAGVRYSLEHPDAYVDANLVGFVNVLEACRHGAVGHLVYASSSSVYGANTRVPFSTHDNVDHPVSLYAATKKANELLAHSYSHLFGLPTTGLRFFTVYGPWGRPDMAYFTFTRAMLAGQPIDVYGEGRMRRDFTYIDDVVDAVVRLLDRPPTADPTWSGADGDPASSAAPYRIYNIGGNRPVALGRFIEVLEECLGVRAERRLRPMQPGDVTATWADVSDLEHAIGVVPDTPLEEGLARFVAWYRDYYET